MSRLTRRVGSALAAVAVLALLRVRGWGGGGDGGGGGAPKRITVWTGDTLPDRVAATQAIVDQFTAATASRSSWSASTRTINQTLTSAAAAGELPDVIGSQPLASVRTLAANELVGQAATAGWCRRWARTPSTSGRWSSPGRRRAARVPSDAWAQLLYYRKDLFDAAGCPPRPPTTPS